MIEFQLSQQDREILNYVHSEALVVRKYAREWDDRESEVPPQELPEAKDFPGVDSLIAKRKDQVPICPLYLCNGIDCLAAKIRIRLLQPSAGDLQIAPRIINLKISKQRLRVPYAPAR